MEESESKPFSVARPKICSLIAQIWYTACTKKCRSKLRAPRIHSPDREARHHILALCSPGFPSKARVGSESLRLYRPCRFCSMKFETIQRNRLWINTIAKTSDRWRQVMTDGWQTAQRFCTGNRRFRSERESSQLLAEEQMRIDLLSCSGVAVSAEPLVWRLEKPWISSRRKVPACTVCLWCGRPARHSSFITYRPLNFALKVTNKSFWTFRRQSGIMISLHCSDVSPKLFQCYKPCFHNKWDSGIYVHSLVQLWLVLSRD